MSNKPKQTPKEDLMKEALRHYEEASTSIHHHNSDIPKAIKQFYQGPPVHIHEGITNTHVDYIDGIIHIKPSKLRQTKYTNRYNDEFTFTDQPDGNVLWEGDFKYCRFGFPNDYSEAYQAYFENECDPPHDHTLSMEQFKEEVHRQLYDEDDKWIGPCDIAQKYAHLVTSRRDIIDMVDPSGGPFLQAGMKIHNKVIKEFKSTGGNYLIVTEK